jgi:predicted O-linked N-acetylglucosamine transferase (SPINDLY family)
MVKDKNYLKVRGNSCIIAGDYQGAIRCAEELLALDKNDIDAMYMAAASYMNNNEYEKAIAMCNQALTINRNYIGLYVVLAHCYKRQFKIAEELDVLNQALEIAEESRFSGEIYSMLGSVYSFLGEHSKSMECFLRACLSEKNNEKKIIEYSNYLFETNYILDISNEEMLKDHNGYNSFFKDICQYQHHSRRSKNKLRIGYVSPDFHKHAVVFFSYPLLANFTKSDFEVYCYSNGREDGVTQGLKTLVTAWRDIRGMNPENAAKLIYDDNIDILVDLAGHTANNCLTILARKPAPIQVSCIGYFNTTGLKEMDYFFTDIYCDPIGQNDNYFSEKLLRLPHSHFCYTAQENMPECQGMPCKKNDFITFGCFNNFSKVTDELLVLWRRILEQVPDSKLILKSRVFASEFGRQRALNRMQELGLEVERIDLRPFSSDYLEQYHEVDIALDTYPYPGGATTCEALYMGVPVISFVGERHGARFGYSILKNLGLEECIASSGDEYVQKAIAFAGDRELLDVLHKNLRTLMRKSSLMDAKQYIEDIEMAYHRMWEKFCSR